MISINLDIKIFCVSLILLYFVLLQEKDLKSYMDECGGILSLTNVKVSNVLHYQLNSRGTCPLRCWEGGAVIWYHIVAQWELFRVEMIIAGIV